MRFTYFAGLPATIVIQTEREKGMDNTFCIFTHRLTPRYSRRIVRPHPLPFLMVSSTDLRSGRRLPQKHLRAPQTRSLAFEFESRKSQEDAGWESYNMCFKLAKLFTQFFFQTALETA